MRIGNFVWQFAVWRTWSAAKSNGRCTNFWTESCQLDTLLSNGSGWGKCESDAIISRWLHINWSLNILVCRAEMLESTVFVHDSISCMWWPSKEFDCTIHRVRCPRKGITNGSAAGSGRDPTRHNRREHTTAGAVAIECGQCRIHHGDLLVARERAQASTLTGQATDRTTAASLWTSKVTVIAAKAWRQTAGAAPVEAIARVRQSDRESIASRTLQILKNSNANDFIADSHVSPPFRSGRWYQRLWVDDGESSVFRCATTAAFDLDIAWERAPARDLRHGRAGRRVAQRANGIARQAFEIAERVLAGQTESPAMPFEQIFQAVVVQERRITRIRSGEFAFAANVGVQRYA